jgi:Tetracyclin repressor-like, C-terminal domain
VITLEQAVEAGCRCFLRHATLDMATVAHDLAVSRATLYRVVGSRDRLVGEVLWRLASQGLDRARQRRAHDGIEGVLEVVRHFARQTLASRPLRTFVAREPETAARVLVTVQRRGITAVTSLFDEVGLAKRDPYDLATPGLVEEPKRVAFLLIRIVESLCFAELAGTRPDLDLTEQTVRGLLVRACTPRQSPARRATLPLARLRDAAFCLVWTSVPEALLTDSRFPMALAGV